MRVRRVRHRKHMAELELFQRDYDWERTAPRGERIVILFYNRRYGRWPELPPGGIPDRFEITSDPWRMREADAVVFHIPSLGALTRVRKFPGQLWVAQSIECPAHYPRLRDPDFLSRFDLTVSYERSADVVTPYYRPEFRELLCTPPRPKSDETLSVLFLSEPREVSGRIAYARELMGEMEVHSYGRQLSNRRLRWDRGSRSKLKTIADYKFTLAFENAIAPDYVTEKFFEPLIAGSVPVYLGAPNVDALAPADRCYIDTADFSGPKELARRLRELGEDEDAYGEYLAWKQRPLRPSFLALLDEQRVPPLVRLCEAVGARLLRRSVSS
jgi:Glycosyltransferase family 10 (fucosyltransferase) C-term/Fucosyltransferase, N-terminal